MMRTLLLACCLAVPAQAASLRPYATLDTATVRLSDLFEGADARPLGPAPAPGGRITVEAPQLAAIARLYAVDWRPAGPGDRAVLERPGRTLGRDDVLPPLRALLQGLGAPAESDIELPAFTSPLLPLGTPAFAFGNTEYDANTGRFATMLQATLPDTPPFQLRLAGRVQEMVVLPVARRALLPGDVLGAADITWARLRIGLARGEIVRAPAQADGQAVRRPLPAGQPILLADLGRPVLVQRGSPIALSLEGPGIQVTAQAVAVAQGGLGEHIQVVNVYSRMILEAEVTGPGRARIVPVAPRPLAPGQHASLLVAAR